MKATLLTVRTTEECLAVGERIARLKLLPLDVLVRKHQVTRTIPQNSRLWALHNAHAAWFNALRMQLIADKKLPEYWPEIDAEEIHRQIFRPMYCGVTRDGKPRSSTRLTKLEMMDAQERYEADLRNKNVDLPEPETWETLG